MSVSDLTNTTWYFNNSLILFGLTRTLSINFTSDSNNYTELYISPNNGQLKYYNLKVYDEERSGWVNEAYRTINITGGTDVTNSDLISWLESNATQQSTTKTYKLGWRVTPAVSLISFTIHSISYQAESGMTWQQWVNSEYNTATFIIDENYVKTSALGLWVGSDAVTPVRPTDTILADTAYGAYGGGEN